MLKPLLRDCWSVWYHFHNNNPVLLWKKGLEKGFFQRWKLKHGSKHRTWKIEQWEKNKKYLPVTTGGKDVDFFIRFGNSALNPFSFQLDDIPCFLMRISKISYSNYLLVRSLLTLCEQGPVSVKHTKKNRSFTNQENLLLDFERVEALLRLSLGFIRERTSYQQEAKRAWSFHNRRPSLYISNLGPSKE